MPRFTRDWFTQTLLDCYSWQSDSLIARQRGRCCLFSNQWNTHSPISRNWKLNEPEYRARPVPTKLGFSCFPLLIRACQLREISFRSSQWCRRLKRRGEEREVMRKIKLNNLNLPVVCSFACDLCNLLSFVILYTSYYYLCKRCHTSNQYQHRYIDKTQSK